MAIDNDAATLHEVKSRGRDDFERKEKPDEASMDPKEPRGPVGGCGSVPRNNRFTGAFSS